MDWTAPCILPEEQGVHEIMGIRETGWGCMIIGCTGSPQPRHKDFELEGPENAEYVLLVSGQEYISVCIWPSCTGSCSTQGRLRSIW